MIPFKKFKVELKEVSDKVKQLAIELEHANKYLKQLIEEHEVYKDAVERGISLFSVDFEPEGD